MKNFKIDHDKLWEKQFGPKLAARDVAGRRIVKSDFNNRDTEFGWSIDHIKPISLGGTDRQENLLIVHWKTNNEKGSSFPEFVANGMRIKIIPKKIKGIKVSEKREYDGWGFEYE